MRKLIILNLFLLFSGLITAQVVVKTNSFVFVDNEFVFIKQELNLNNNSDFYLRNNGQLLQGTNGLGLNTGLGNLSVYQEGTVNNYQYNYWCSPIGIPSNSVGNSNFGISLLNRPNSITSSTPATILAYPALNGVSSPLSIAERWIYKYVTSNSYAQWSYVGSATTIQSGLGFTMKGTSGTDGGNNIGSAQRYDFRGLPNDGTISNLVSNNNFTLIGNPYPSAIDLNLFLLDPTNASLIDGSAYFWEQGVVNSHVLAQYQGGYGTYTSALGYIPATFYSYDGSGNQGTSVGTGNSFQRRFSPIGQGFMVRGVASGSVVMNNLFRAYRKEGIAFNSEFAKINNTSNNFEEIPNVANIDYTQISKDYVPQIRIDAIYNDAGVRPTILGFSDSATDGFDYSMDGRSPSSETSSFYYALDDSQFEFVGSVVQFDINKKIPIGFRNNTVTNFKIKVVSTSFGFDDSQIVYIHDKENNLYYDIKNGVFDITLPIGDNRTRFEITFKENSLYQENQNIINDLQIFNNNNILFVENPKNRMIDNLMIYDITGKLILERVNIGDSNHFQIDLNEFSNGIYIVNLKSENSNIKLKMVKNDK